MSRSITAILLISLALISASEGQNSTTVNPQCGQNEVWVPCGTQQVDAMCTEISTMKLDHTISIGLGPVCLPGEGFCVCEQGFVRDNNWQCINPEQC